MSSSFYHSDFLLLSSHHRQCGCRRRRGTGIGVARKMAGGCGGLLEPGRSISCLDLLHGNGIVGTVLRRISRRFASSAYLLTRIILDCNLRDDQICAGYSDSSISLPCNAVRWRRAGGEQGHCGGNGRDGHLSCDEEGGRRMLRYGGMTRKRCSEMDGAAEGRFGEERARLTVLSRWRVQQTFGVPRWRRLRCSRVSPLTAGRWGWEAVW